VLTLIGGPIGRAMLTVIMHHAHASRRWPGRSVTVAVELGDGLLGVYVMLALPGGLAHFLAARISGLDWICRPPGPLGHRL
jgi:hypothetical protein